MIALLLACFAWAVIGAGFFIAAALEVEEGHGTPLPVALFLFLFCVVFWPSFVVAGMLRGWR